VKAVILAAGDGGRLGGHTARLPKPIVPLHGRPIIWYTLDALVRAGVDDVTIVTGYLEGELRAALSRGLPGGLRPKFVNNPRFHDGASLSLRAAREACAGGPVLLAMSDHLLSAPLVAKLLLEARGPAIRGVSSVAADSGAHDPSYREEATKLAVDAQGFVTAIGKTLPAWSALDTGAFVLAPAAWDAVDEAPEDCELSVIFSLLAGRRALRAIDVSGAFWYDIDTEEDLAAAGALLAPNPASPRTASPAGAGA
jgi:choline kinase